MGDRTVSVCIVRICMKKHIQIVQFYYIIIIYSAVPVVNDKKRFFSFYM